MGFVRTVGELCDYFADCKFGLVFEEIAHFVVDPSIYFVYDAICYLAIVADKS
jgi:hypothetical protein